MDGEAFAEWLADEIDKSKLTRNELADRSGVSVVTIRHYLYKMRSPTLLYMTLLLDAFGKKLVIVDK